MKSTQIAMTNVVHKGKDYGTQIALVFEDGVYYLSAANVVQRTGTLFNARVQKFYSQADAAKRYAEAVEALIFESGVF